MKMDNMRLIMLGALVLLIFSLQGTVKKESIESIEGEACNVDDDCPCFGRYNATEAGGTLTGDEARAWGIGVGRCEDSACDMSYCFDVEPWVDWAREKPLDWLTDKENAMTVLAIIVIGIGLIAWPKL